MVGEISAWETFDSTRDSVFKSAADEDSRQARTESEEEASEAAERRLQEWLWSGTHRDLSESPFQALAEWLQFRWRSLAGSEAVCLTASSFLPHAGFLIFTVSGSRYCQNVEREHSHAAGDNVIVLICDIRRGALFSDVEQIHVLSQAL